VGAGFIVRGLLGGAFAVALLATDLPFWLQVTVIFGAIGLLLLFYTVKSLREQLREEARR
jgi:membrane protein implicated in regulation of membrane protease activity